MPDPNATTAAPYPYPQSQPTLTLIGAAENMKLLFDLTMSLNQQALIDNQVNARRRSSNDGAFDHVVSMAAAAALLQATQAGEDTTTTAAGAEETANAATATANATMNYVVCVHHGSQRLAWRVSDFEVMEYFKHLKPSTCPRGLSRADKINYMAGQASEGL